MIEKTITFLDMHGNEATGLYRFHLNQDDATQLELSYPGGLEEHFKKLISERDIAEFYRLIRVFVLSSYGELDPNGINFQKIRGGNKLYERFESSPAFSVLMEELLEVVEEKDPETGENSPSIPNLSAFLKGIAPMQHKKQPKKGAVVGAVTPQTEG